MSRALFRLHDDGVTEVIGYVLSFALSAIFLLIALNVFTAARGNTDHVVTGVELKTIADRVSSRIVEMGLLSQEFENATMEVTMIIPQSLNGRLYTVSIAPEAVSASTDDGMLVAESTTYKTDAIPNIDVSGEIGSSNEVLRLRYTLVPDDPNPPIPTITLLGE